MKPGWAKEALDQINYELKRAGVYHCYCHGTTADKLIQIDKCDGYMKTSISRPARTGQEAHDFAGGVYCLKDNFRGALSFAIDRSWWFAVPGAAPRHNPAVILFTKPFLDTMSKRIRNEVTMDVRTQPVYKQGEKPKKQGKALWHYPVSYTHLTLPTTSRV